VKSPMSAVNVRKPSTGGILSSDIRRFTQEEDCSIHRCRFSKGSIIKKLNLVPLKMNI
jgi:hypothetical protein